MTFAGVDSAKQCVYSYIHRLAIDISDRDRDSRRSRQAFYSLLWDRVAVDRRDVIQALDAVIASNEFGGERGLQFINRCYYTLCNPWHYRPDRVIDLEWVIGQLQRLPEPKGQNRLTLALRRRLSDFKQSDYTPCLLRQLRLGGYPGYNDSHRQNRGIIGDLLPDYFYLYRSTTRTDDIEELEKSRFNNDARYSGVGSKQLFKLKETYRSLNQYPETCFNPTTLPNAEFQQVWQQYHPNQENGFRAKSQRFQNSIRPEMPLQTIQPLINNYLLQPIQEVQTLNTRKWLQYNIQGIWDSFELDGPAMRTSVILSFERALDALFLPGFTKQNVQRFKALVVSIGSMQMTNILLNIVLACPMARFRLEKKLGYLYSSFEDAAIEVERWLVDFFECMNVALVLNARQLLYLQRFTSI